MKHRRQRRLFLRFRDHRDYDALTQLFDATAPSLMALASHLVREIDCAEDLVQTTYLVAIERAQAYDADRDIYPWLAGILVNKARQWNRRTDRTIDPDRLPERAGEPDPVVAAGGLEVSAALHGALEELPDTYRHVLVPYLEQGEQPRSIAERLGIAPGTARVRIHRGLDMLRKALPAGFAAGGLAGLIPLRGLDFVRATVLQQARLTGEGAVVAAGSSVAFASALQALQLAGIAAGLALASGAAWMLAGKVMDEDTAGMEALEPLVEALDPPSVPPTERAPVRDEVPAVPGPETAAEHSLPGKVDKHASEGDPGETEPLEPGAAAALGWSMRVWTDATPPGHVLLREGTALVGSHEVDIQSILDTLPEARSLAERLHAETPQHEVRIEELYAMRTEVTVEQYLAYVLDEAQRVTAESNSEQELKSVVQRAQQLMSARGLEPHAQVDFAEAQAYAAWAGLRLPTEFEWQYAARGGAADAYPWGDRWDSSKAAGLNHSLGSGVTPVGSFPEGATRKGLLDMAGNVAEWTSSPYTAYPGHSPMHYTDGSSGGKIRSRIDFGEKWRVVVGGSWGDTPELLRAAGRRPEKAGVRSETIGLRTFGSARPGRDAIAHAAASAGRAADFDCERAIGIDRWWVRSQLGLVGPEGYEVIMGYDHIAFAPVTTLDHNEVRDLTERDRWGSVLVGLLSTDQPILSPALEPGLYLVRLRSDDISSGFLELTGVDGGASGRIEEPMVRLRGNMRRAEHKSIGRSGQLRIGVGIPDERRSGGTELNFGLKVEPGPWRQ